MICTSICAAQSAQAVALAQSAKHHLPDCKVIVCLIAKEKVSELEYEEAIDEVFLSDNIGSNDFGLSFQKGHPCEQAPNSKATFLDFAYTNFQNEQTFVYLAPTTQVFSSFPEIEQALARHSILLIGHLLSPPPIEQVIWEDNAEVELARVGVLNDSLIGIRRSRTADQFLSWWKERVMHSASIDPITGFCASQKWLTSSLALFEDVFILKHPGYNVAYWNLMERELSADENTYTVDGEPLRCFNFSEMNRLESDSSGPLDQLICSYRKKLDRYWSRFPKQGLRGHHPHQKRRRR